VLPDSSVRCFGPVEAAWPGPDAARLTLYTPYPCPAADQVTFSYYLPEGTKNAELSLYDLSGRLVESSVSVPTTPGRHENAYDTSKLASRRLHRKADHRQRLDHKTSYHRTLGRIETAHLYAVMQSSRVGMPRFSVNSVKW
jgi:hypothetical protein